MSVNISAIQKLTAPNPFCLVSSLEENGTTNLMALSWWTYVSNNPATVCIAMSKRGHSHTLIERTGEFAINIVGPALSEQAFRCGTCSGRSTDKAAEFGIALEPAQSIGAQVVSGCRAVMECRVQQEIEVSDHVLFIAEVVAAAGSPDVPALYAVDGYARLAEVTEK